MQMRSNVVPINQYHRRRGAELPAAPSYRIGINTEVTGTGAQIGDLSIRAARLAVEEINAAGGVGGVPLALLVRDCRSDAAMAVEQYRQAIANDRLVALLGPLKLAYAVRIVPDHRSARLPMLIGATNATLTQQGDPNLFRMRTSDALTAAAMTGFAVDQLSARRVAIVHDADAFGSGGADTIVGDLAQRGLAPIAREHYVTGNREFDALVSAVKAAQSHAVLIYGTNPTDVGLLLRTIRYWKLFYDLDRANRAESARLQTTALGNSARDLARGLDALVENERSRIANLALSRSAQEFVSVRPDQRSALFTPTLADLQTSSIRTSRSIVRCCCSTALARC